jgi:hypothetical protein
MKTMTNNLLKNLTATFVIFFTVGVGGAWAQDGMSHTPNCKGEDISKWDRCYGEHVFESGGIYKGEWRDGRLNGKGIYITDDGRKFEGLWKNGERVLANKNLLNDIEFQKNPNNLAICPAADFSKNTDIERTWKWNNCWGKYIFEISGLENGFTAEAEFKDGLPNGMGAYYFVKKGYKGDMYVGEIKNGIRNGKGTYYFLAEGENKGDKFVGDFRDDKKNGRGTYVWADGGKYVGEFKDDKKHGQGIYFRTNGQQIEGIFENDKLVSSSKVSNVAGFKDNLSEEEPNQSSHVTSEIGGMDKLRRNLEAKRNAAKNNQNQDNFNSNTFELERQQIANERKKLEEEKRSRAQARNSQRINLQISNTQPNANGEFTVSIKTNSDTASLKINGDEQGGKEDGVYQIKRIARAGQVTQLIVFAEDVYGNTDTKTIAVNRKITQSNQVRYAELNPAQIKSQPSKDAVAIIIGIADYKNLPRADYANDDARTFYDYAVRGLGVRAENIKLLVDAEADEIEILRAFKTWLPARVKATTDVYVYYSGHGLPTDDGTGLYLLPQRADRDFLSDTALQQERINQALQATKPKSVTIFLDSCYSGMARTGQTLLASARPITLKASAQTFPADFTVISASTSEQISSSSNELKHGIFSYYLMRGMEGDADTNKDGKITTGEMHSYLMDNVTRQASLVNRVQQPQLAGDANRVLVGR